MSKRRTVLIVFITGLIFLISVWLFSPLGLDKSDIIPDGAGRSTGKSIASPSSGAVPKPVLTERALSSSRVSIPLPSKSAIYQEYERAPSLRAFFSKYAVDSAPPEAKYLAAKVAIDDCRRVSFGSKGYRDNMESRLKEGSATKVVQQAAIARVEQKCGGDWTDMPPSKERAYELMRSASQSGNTAAMAYLLADTVQTASGAELADKVGQFLASNDLSTIEQAMRAILSVGQRTGQIPLTDGEVANPNVFADAWLLAMCDIGKDCGPDSIEVVAACAAGFCGVSSLEDYVRLHSRTPNDFVEIMK